MWAKPARTVASVFTPTRARELRRSVPGRQPPKREDCSNVSYVTDQGEGVRICIRMAATLLQFVAVLR